MQGQRVLSPAHTAAHCRAHDAGEPPHDRERAANLAIDERSVHLGRLTVADALTGWGLHHLVDDACLLTSEVITNSIRHAKLWTVSWPALITLRIVRTDTTVEISVYDGDPRPPRAVERITTDDLESLPESGFGLLVVARQAAAWGTTTFAGGKRVWFTLPLD